MAWGALVDRTAAGAPDPADALRRAERFCEAAQAAGILDPAAIGDDAAHILTLACQRAPYLATS